MHDPLAARHFLAGVPVRAVTIGKRLSTVVRLDGSNNGRAVEVYRSEIETRWLLLSEWLKIIEDSKRAFLAKGIEVCPNCGPRRGPIEACPFCATFGAHDGFCYHAVAVDLWPDLLEMAEEGLLPADPCDHTFSEFGTGQPMTCSLSSSHTHGPGCDCDTEPHQSIEHLIGFFRAEKQDHRDDGQCHSDCWEQAVREFEEARR